MEITIDNIYTTFNSKLAQQNGADKSKKPKRNYIVGYVLLIFMAISIVALIFTSLCLSRKEHPIFNDYIPIIYIIVFIGVLLIIIYKYIKKSKKVTSIDIMEAVKGTLLDKELDTREGVFYVYKLCENYLNNNKPSEGLLYEGFNILLGIICGSIFNTAYPGNSYIAVYATLLTYVLLKHIVNFLRKICYKLTCSGRKYDTIQKFWEGLVLYISKNYV